MIKLYYEDIYMTEFEAVVTDCTFDTNTGHYHLILDQTAFFPEEGGQVADKGTLNGYAVINVQIQNDVITHIVSVTEPTADISAKDTNSSTDGSATVMFRVGSTVHGHIDWEQRFDFMQQHSGEHIISGLIHKHYGYNNVGFHLGLQEVTLDFNGELSLEQLRVIEAEANDIVWQNLPVEISYPSPEELQTLEYRSKLELTENVRIVEIPNTDTCACCAPHVAYTGQIGLIKITNVQSHRGGIRVNILCGKRAVTDYTEKQNSVSNISVQLSAKQAAVTEAVRKLKEDNLRLRELGNALQASLLDYAVTTLPNPTGTLPSSTDTAKVCNNAILFVDLWNEIAIRNKVNELASGYPGYSAIFAGNDEAGYRFIIGSTQRDCRQLAALLRQTFQAKGGGTAPMIQGTIHATKTALEEFLQQQ